MTTTISTAGTTTISLSEWSTLIVSTTGAGSIEFASGAEKLKSSSTAKLTNTTYGPFGVPTTATVTLTTGSFTYDLGGIHNVTAQTDAATGKVEILNSTTGLPMVGAESTRNLGTALFEPGNGVLPSVSAGAGCTIGSSGLISENGEMVFQVTATAISGASNYVDFNVIRCATDALAHPTHPTR